jgi:hypothetical protein
MIQKSAQNDRDKRNPKFKKKINMLEMIERNLKVAKSTKNNAHKIIGERATQKKKKNRRGKQNKCKLEK